MTDANSLPSPMVSSLKITADAPTAFHDPTLYRQIAGALQYLTFTRPDISYVANKLCQYMHQPQTYHWNAMKRLLRYLAGTPTHGLLFTPNTHPSIQAFTDADWGSNPDDRKSTIGYCIFIGTNLISWSSKKQVVVSHSSTEAEYRSIASTCTKISWLMSLLKEINLHISIPIINSDNLSTMLLTANPVMHTRILKWIYIISVTKSRNLKSLFVMFLLVFN